MKLKHWLALIRAPGLGPQRFKALQPLIDAGNQPGDGPLAFKRSALETAQLPKTTINALLTPDWAKIEQDLRWLEAPDQHLLTRAHAAYPSAFLQLSNPPVGLFVKGDIDVLSTPAIAMVGSRNPTPAAERSATEFAQHLAGAGLAVVSGLALGIDSAAHRGALQAPNPGGLTIAACGTGLGRVYPARNKALAHEIANSGALISEYPPDTGPRSQHFPLRNRLISALSLGTLVVEAALQSGSLITAQHALEQGKEVFAMPGSIHNPLARGCHALIRQGAKLVETADHVLEELGPLLSQPLPSNSQTATPVTATPDTSTAAEPDPDYKILLAALGYEPATIDQLVQRCGLTAPELSSMLLLLELQDQVEALPGGRYQRR